MNAGAHSRKRERVRNLFSRPSNSSSKHDATSQTGSRPPPQARLSSNASASHIPLLNKPGQKFLEEALLGLTSEERATVQQHLCNGRQDVRLAVEDAYNAALRQKQMCESKRWQWGFHGHSVFLRDEAEKAMVWLDRFKSIGDVVANADPIHIGLPWAGIRMILEVVVSESRQMAALLIGMNLAMYMAHRLRVYFDFLQPLPSTQAKENFEDVLVLTYTHVLRILAKALQTFQMNSSTRTWHALWRLPLLEDLAFECEKLGSRCEIEASNCDRELHSQRWEDAKQWKEDLRTALRDLDEIGGIKNSLALLQVKVDLAHLTTARGATYNSYAEGVDTQCLPGTRTQLLREIAHWADDPNGKSILWLSGMAGSGKSTVSRSVARALDDRKCLGASFFFKRGEGDRGNASLLFPTIARQLADRIPGLNQSIAKALDTDSLLCERNIQEQFEKLILQPLINVMPHPTSSGLTIVIDALDECDPSTEIRGVLKLLARVGAIVSLRLRFFVTSKPELPITLEFRTMAASLHQDVGLEDVQIPTIEHDLHTYFTHRFREIEREDSLSNTYDPLPLDWPGEDSIQALVKLAIPSFIFASTVCRYISESNPKYHLDDILQRRGYAGLDKTYLPILDHAIVERGKRKCDQAIAELRELLGPMVLLQEPLSPLSLSSLLEIPLRDISDILRPLRSVLKIPSDRDAPIRLYHPSFRDFLLDPEGQPTNRFWIDKVQTHIELAKHCLRLLNQPETLKQDLLGVGKPGLRRADISTHQITSSIAADVAYACCHWVWHQVQSGKKLRDGGHVHLFFQLHFLHWLEALSWLARVSHAVAQISALETLVDIDHGSDLLAFLDDAKRFVLQNRYVIDLAPLQLYISALIFTPLRSIVRRTFNKRIPLWLSVAPHARSLWGPEIQKLEGHEREVNGVTFSPDGQLIASASGDETIKLWTAATGEEWQTLKGHEEWVNAVTFSPDGKMLASSSLDRTVRLWSSDSWDEIQRLEGHGDWVTAIAFSSDGQILASASADQTVRTWDTTTGEQKLILEGHDDWVRSVAISPDRKTIASASRDRTVRLWSMATGRELHRLEGHKEWVNGVAFFPNGQLVASASGDKTIKLWCTETGTEIRSLEGHSDWVNAVALSLDGQKAASASHDNTVRLWNTTTGEELQRFQGHDQWVNCLAFSPNGQAIASASGDKTIRIWEFAEDCGTEKLQGHEGYVHAILFSPNGEMVASASEDKTVRLWNALTCECVQQLEGHQDEVWALAYSPDGQLLASASNDQTVRVWDTTTGTETLRLSGFDNWITALAFSSDGQTIISRANDETMRLWNISTGEEIQGTPDVGCGNRTAFANQPFPSQNGNSAPNAALVLSDQWVQYRDQDLLWLPLEYRGTCSSVYGSTLVLGQASGLVAFFIFDFEQC